MSDHNKEIDHLSGVETTGHEWDGLKELNNPLPRWWLWTWYVTIIWGIGYWIVYPAWPLLESHTKGVFGYSSRAEGQASYDALVAKRLEQGAGLKEASVEDILADDKLRQFAVAQGAAAFGDNCAACHGTGAAGNKGGFPNLVDDDWLWGGTVDAIHETLRVGIRSGHDDERAGEMSAFGRDELLEKDEIETVASYVQSLTGNAPEGADLEAGKVLFEENCAACHGEDAKGDQEFGAPNLTDAIWLYGGDRESIIETIYNGRKGVMPSWETRLDPVTVKSLAVYVHTRGGGQ